MAKSLQNRTRVRIPNDHQPRLARGPSDRRSVSERVRNGMLPVNGWGVFIWGAAAGLAALMFLTLVARAIALVELSLERQAAIRRTEARQAAMRNAKPTTEESELEAA